MSVGENHGTRDSGELFGQALRASALRDESSGAEPIDLGQVWRDLRSGCWKIADDFHSDARCYLVLIAAPDPAPHRRSLGVRDLDLLERVLTEGSQKRVALSLGVSTSTIAGASKSGLASMGLSCLASKVPPLLVLAARASKGESPLGDERVTRLHDGKSAFRIVSASRPDDFLAELLPPAEFAVVRLVVDGRSHAEIAVLRRCSRRTVANQLASVFQRLSVSGRAELLLHLSAQRAAGQPANGNARPAPVDRVSAEG